MIDRVSKKHTTTTTTSNRHKITKHKIPYLLHEHVGHDKVIDPERLQHIQYYKVTTIVNDFKRLLGERKNNHKIFSFYVAPRRILTRYRSRCWHWCWWYRCWFRRWCFGSCRRCRRCSWLTFCKLNCSQNYQR
jgi:hypothetical protein